MKKLRSQGPSLDEAREWGLESGEQKSQDGRGPQVPSLVASGASSDRSRVASVLSARASVPARGPWRGWGIVERAEAGATEC